MTSPAQPTLWGAAASEAAAQAGIDQAASNKASLLTFAREVAAALGRHRPEGITADDVVRALAEQHHISEHALGNSAGGLFRGSSAWRWTGTYRKSERVHAHANELKVWRFIG